MVTEAIAYPYSSYEAYVSEKEFGDRIQAALIFCGYDIPKDKTIISLAPGDKRKRGSHYDLAMTIALLYQTDQISAKDLSSREDSIKSNIIAKKHIVI